VVVKMRMIQKVSSCLHVERNTICLQLAHWTEGPTEAVLEMPCNGKAGDGASREGETSSRPPALCLHILAEHIINVPAASTWLGTPLGWVTRG